MNREQKKIERKQRKAKVRAAQYAASAARKHQKGTVTVKRPTRVVYSRAIINKKIRLKQFEADDRNEVWAALSPQNQLISLNERRGQSKKQKAKIQKRIDAANKKA